MDIATYQTMSMIFGLILMIAVLIAICSFVLVLVRWKTPARFGHVRRMNWALLTVGLLVGIQYFALFYLLLPAIGRQQMAIVNAARDVKVKETSLVNVGDSVPDFEITTVDGDELLFPEPGKFTLINFFATWCGPCQVELPHIEQIWSQRKGNDRFRLLVIGREETVESVREFREKHGFTFPIAADPDRRVYSLFATGLIPRTLVVSPDGQVVYSKVGFYEEDLEELESILEQQVATAR